MKYSYLSDLSEVIELQEQKAAWIDLHRLGRWHHPRHGVLTGTVEKFKSFIANWRSNVLGRKVIFDKSHDFNQGGTGFLQDMKIDGNKLKGLVEFTPFGIDLIRNKGFIYFSPEYRDSFLNKETRENHGPTLMGGALTPRPFLTNLTPIVLSEEIDNSYFKHCDDLVMNDVGQNIDIVMAEVAEERQLSIDEIEEILMKHINTNT